MISQAKLWPHCCLPISPSRQVGKRLAFVMKTLLPTSATICQCSERLRAGELNARVGTQCIAQIWACVFSLLAIVSSFLWMSKHTFRWAVIPLSLRTPPHPSIRSPIFYHIFISDGEPGDKMVVGFILSPHLERRPKLLVTKMLDLSWISFHRFLCTYRSLHYVYYCYCCVSNVAQE